MDTVKLLNYMDNLRYARKMSQEAYLHNVISQRQYYRYRRGESEVPFEVIVKFSNKLQIPLFKLISAFQSHAEKENLIIRQYFNLIISKQLNEAKSFLSKQADLLFIDEETHLFFNLSNVLLDFYSKDLTSEEMVVLLKREVDFTRVMKKDILHDSELYLLGVIMEYSDEDREAILKKIGGLIRNNRLLLAGNPLFDLQVYFWLVKNLGRLQRYDEVYEMADFALEYSKKNYSYYLVEYFHYYKALAYYRNNNMIDFENELSKALYVLLQLEKYKRDHFFEVINKDTNIKCKEFLLKKLEEEL
ncbi:MAG: hypothetical protein PHF05_01805 [Candidatus Izemoplasmatales bacterium]|nr:hypothetical protein [Candidatus Izemoplasmatales bacterium]